MDHLNVNIMYSFEGKM